ncbi:MAG: hypothetical protein M1820_002465 [Bogoriella megaspora]|nr:MAG: hypothetical protein M1820_002465 [Bogoriella megaspora]
MHGTPISDEEWADELNARMENLGITELPSFPNCYPSLNPIDTYRAHLADILEPITGADRNTIYNAIQWTITLDKGDLVLPVPALRLQGTTTDAISRDIIDRFPDSPLVKKPEIEKTIVKFFFKPQPLSQLLIPCILKKGPEYGFNPINGLRDPSDPSKGRKRIIVEFSSPNIAKPFHAGHLRSTIIGGFLAHLYSGAGWKVITMNYLGDWGKQYGMLATGFFKFGSENLLVKNPIGHLYDVYVKISSMQREEEKKIKALRQEVADLKAKDESTAEKEAQIQDLLENGVDEQARKCFKRMVNGDEEAVNTWKGFRDLSIKKYKETYARLNISFDDYSGESQVKDESIEKAAKTLADKKVSELSEGAVIVDLTKHNQKLGKAIVQKKDGTSLYLTRDIGAIQEREERYDFDRMLYVVASQQDLHLAQLFKIVELMGRKDLADKCQHINFGMVLGMSTRKGTAKFLDDILRDVGEHMHGVMKKTKEKYEQVEDPERTADILGISAVMVQDMTGKRINNYEFDMDRMCSFDGDTGPYLQYAHARLCSITRNAKVDPAELLSADLSLLKEQHAVDLVRSLAQWPDVFSNTLKTLEPVTVLVYLFKMSHALSQSYDHLWVVGSEPELKKARLALYTCARHVLNNGMRLLGLSPVER